MLGPVGAAAQTAAPAQAPTPIGGWQAGAVLDVSVGSRKLGLGLRDKGLALGHSDLTAYGPLGAHLQAQLTAVVHSHERKVETELEDAWVQSRTLPAGLQVRAGRFASQLGYLNELHPHTDDFVERPLLYRGFLGDHWIDDGLRVNWTAPTDLYLRLGVEVFRGRGLVDGQSSGRPGAAVLSAKTGGDIGASHSWQAGLAMVHNRRQAADEHEHEEGELEEEEHDAHEGHGHSHGAAYAGRRMWIADLAWKWAPGGNNSQQQVRVLYEYAQVRGADNEVGPRARHSGQYLSAVWRFDPSWEAGVRHDLLRVSVPHDDHAHTGRLRESALMLAWKPTHMQTLRLQVTQQRGRGELDERTRGVHLQYILNFGAHAAHTF
ncbi:hypothetical protein HQN59_11945 [Schlegelella sp. ID0723]|uniref:Zinc-regulated TonB-dependent outer membrane receptor n=1 Tax=Piscinibacter koreensis TaxID=2742824 RepID=A0A7Y6NNJ3_9BURK|nr:hypothetical protein [Schlegelella koreensis]